MPVYDNTSLGQFPTVPENIDQPTRFGALSETVKDAFVTELTNFFNTKYDKLRLGELPRIEKYAVSGDALTDPLETAATVVRSFPDVVENLPTIAVLSTTGKNLKLGLSDKTVGMVIPKAKIISPLPGPFALADFMTLVVNTIPTGVATAVQTSTFTFRSLMFADITHATLDEVIAAINSQALYAKAYASTSGGVTTLGVGAGGSHGREFPNMIEIVGGTAVAALGFTAGQSDTNYGATKVAYVRHHIAGDLTVSIEVLAESENVRTELSDLLYDFLTYVMTDRNFQFYGRSTFDESILDETYQIIFKDNDISFTGEQEIPRANDQRDKIYINRLNIPVTAIQYSDRVITNKAGQAITPALGITIIGQDDLPEPN